MPKLELKEDDTLPKLTDTLATAESLAGGTVELYLQQQRSDSMIVNAGSATVTDTTAGSADVEYQLSSSETANVGTHRGEWLVTYSDGDTETFPKDGYFFVTFDAQLNRGGTVVTPSTSGRAGPIDVLLLNELASDPGSPAADDWGLYVDTSGNLQKVDENGSVTNIGAPDVSNDGSVVNTTPTDINFGDGVDATDDGDDTVSVTANETEIDHDSLNGFVVNQHIDHGNIDILANDGLKGGGNITSGVQLAVEPDDFAGAGLVDDGSDDLASQTVVEQTGDYTASKNDFVLADASGGDFNVTLPTPSTAVAPGVKLTSASGNVTIKTPGAGTIDGQTNMTLKTQYASRTFVANATDYFIK